MTDQAVITINLLDVNEAPDMNDQVFSVEHFSPNGTSVGTIAATDPDNGQTLTFSIVSGNTGGTFAVNPSSGLITVADNTLLDLYNKP
jgi:large repetitive protein